MQRTLQALAVTLVLLGSGIRLPAQGEPPAESTTTPSLAQVLERLGAYLDRYADELSKTVSTERYKQTAGSGPTYSEALLESEFGIVKVPNYPGWLGFRDVLKIDGRAVKDHDSRLQELLLNPSPEALLQAKRITEESARQNIGALQRNINNPALVLELFDRRNHPRLRYSKAGEEIVEQVHAWQIRYDEQQLPTIIMTPQGKNVPVSGYIWVDPGSGALLRAEVNVKDFFAAVGFGSSKAQMRVFFRNDQKLKFWVPVRMTERYEVGGLGSLTGDASYTNYRQFGTETKEDFDLNK